MLKIFRRIRKGIRDIGSGGKDILRNNPEALMAAIGIPYLLNTMGGAGGGGGGSGFMNFVKNIIGTTGATGVGGKGSAGYQDPSGIMGMGQSLLKGLTGGKGVEGNAGLISLIMSMLAKKQFDKEVEGPLDKSERLSEIDIKYDDITGGSPFAKDRFRGTHYNPVDDKYYDYKTSDGEFKNYEIDEEGRVIEEGLGRISGLQAGGNPFMNRNRIRGSLGGGMNPSGWSPDPTVKSITGYEGGGIPYIDPYKGTLGGGMPGRKDPTIEGIMGYNPRYINRANGGTTAGDLADTLEDNPGISQFFPRKFGMIHGPGGPKEDKIPAMLSDGEFVMTAKAVDNAGGPQSMYNLMNRLDPESSKGTGIV
jgi:hypothetical protein